VPSETNVEIVRRAYAALTDGVEAMLAFTDPGFEMTTPASLSSEPDTYRGHDGVRRYYSSFGDAMEGFRIEGREFTPVGEKVVVDTTFYASGRATGIETGMDAFLVWTVHDGLVSRMETFAGRDEAIDAAGRP
jgi:ketosteroid isomerase-like protein